MKIPFSAAAFRFVLLGLLTSANVLPMACTKDPDPVVLKDYSAEDEAIIQKFLADSAITTAQKQPSGLYYVPIVTNPNNVRATKGKRTSVLYTGQLMDGTVFDASSKHGNVPFTFVVGSGNVIRGWDEGLPLMHKGDKGMLIIPSALGYGPNASGDIPANSVIRFKLEVTEIQ
ncbi:FKBP-type peptidyl-prolyl cis-trans isomerase [Hymenobacter negativus]|uniref:Peptidyl-prolyl cis-trans isomerase n=1 Tax=Hymenobacter negativus TaxID=2795026 RepID=A0ABS3QJE9_9BACT|nr:FKBP-type peptidyl-prolyl cis-trans isomerase [Hymenobacter negativus]MBO2011123.1 FKBP-type peptidyl-prolyl cis-trans isomerase [Hymenobacter negativus]